LCYRAVQGFEFSGASRSTRMQKLPKRVGDNPQKPLARQWE
jgi:hypothetical protein